ncbi:MAG: hypothetical protein RLZ12_525 [Bacillota bacterium]|jgi:hypothetical protein
MHYGSFGWMHPHFHNQAFGDLPLTSDGFCPRTPCSSCGPDPAWVCHRPEGCTPCPGGWSPYPNTLHSNSYAAQDAPQPSCGPNPNGSWW